MSRDGYDDPDWGMSSWMRAYYGQGTSFLTERAVRRVAQYHRSIANLTKQGSAEPRLWIGALQSFWSGLADDYGDYLRTSSGREAGADPIEVLAEEPLVVTVRINEGARTDQQTFDLPRSLRDSTMTNAKLSTRGLFAGNRCLLRPGYHLHIEPKNVTRDVSSCKLRFENLPGDLTAGMTLIGTIVAERTQTKPRPDSYDRADAVAPSPVLVAIIQAKVI